MTIAHLERHPDGVRHAVDDNNRHEYLLKWLEMFRGFGYATRDDSWGELEKILDIVHRNYLEMQVERLRNQQGRIEEDIQSKLKTLSDYGHVENLTNE